MFFCIFSTLSILCWTKNFWPINKNLAHFAHRFFSTQKKFAHWSKNPGCTTATYLTAKEKGDALQ
jgi:hypothetical protein